MAGGHTVYPGNKACLLSLHTVIRMQHGWPDNSKGWF